MKIRISLAELTLGDMEDFEDISGIPFDEIAQMAREAKDEEGESKKSLPTKALIALTYISERRDNPDYTIEDARAIKVLELEFDETEEDTGEEESKNPLSEGGDAA